MLDAPTKARLDAELADLNNAVRGVLAQRRVWMDSHMADYAKYPIGTVIYDLRTGNELGTVTRHYRYWSGRDDRYDEGMNIEYEFKIPGHRNIFDNTSHHAGALRIGTAEELAQQREIEARLAGLRGPEGHTQIQWAKVFAKKASE